MTRQTTKDILASGPSKEAFNPLIDDEAEGAAAEAAAASPAEPDFNPLLDAQDDDGDESGYGASEEEDLANFTLPGVGSLRRPPSPRPVAKEKAPVAPAVEPLDHDDIDLLLGLDGLGLPEADGEDEDDHPFSEDSLEEIFGHVVAEDSNSSKFQADWGLDDELLTSDEDEDDEFAGFDLDSVLATAIDRGASDVDLAAGDQVVYSILGEIHRAPEFLPVSGDITQRLQQSIISHVLESEFVEELELDTSYVIKSGRHKGRRTRLSVGKSFGDVFLVFRVIADQIPSPEDLGITGELLEWADLPNGLVLVCGPTGTGKSTTFASLVNKINLERPQKVITLEKPIEYVYDKGRAMVTQREIGRDARSFASALTSAMRQHPDIIMVGEVRNQEEISELLRASESGHLAMSTMHTNSAAATINRIQSLFEGDEQKRILGSLADNLRGIANQVLIKSPDGASRFAVREVLSVDEEVSSMILAGDTRAIRAYQIEREATMEHELVKAVVANRCTREAARAQSPFPRYFDELLSQTS